MKRFVVVGERFSWCVIIGYVIMVIVDSKVVMIVMRSVCFLLGVLFLGVRGSIILMVSVVEVL